MLNYAKTWLKLATKFSLIFSSVLLGIPGPAVIALFHSGINFGFKKTLPFFFGIISGFLFNLSISFLGITVFIEYETVFGIFKIVMLGYIFYLAYKIATSKPLEDKINVQPMSFYQGLFFNLLNPKAYIAALSVISQFSLVAD